MELLFMFVLFIFGSVVCLLYKFIRWLISPVVKFAFAKNSYSVTEENGEEVMISEREISDEPEEQTVIVKTPYFNTDKIQEYSTKIEQRKFIYRPQTLDEYIGQEKSKALVRLNLKKIKQLKPVHFLISGQRGCGKTTLAYIIRNSLNAKMIERVAGEITNPDQIIELVNQINNSSEPYVILFIDEIHALKPQLCENFYPIMEDYKIAGKRIKPFILIGATTEKNILMTKVAPMVDRFSCQIELENYSREDITEIIRRYRTQLFPDKELSETHYKVISYNCKYVPRIAITLLEDSLIEPDIKKVLDCHRIIKDGLTDIDLKILQILEENNRPIGEKALAQMIGISQADYTSLYESYLISQEYILRTAHGRVLAKKGKDFLEAMNQEAVK